MLASLDRLARRGKRRNRSEVVRAALEQYLAREARRERERREAAIFRANRDQLERDVMALIEDQAAT
jgi:Arc/MetJ-type ribon-helix-helix transcriptional regulator